MKNNIQIIEINQEKIVEKKFPCNEKNDLDNFNYYQKKNEDKINERKRRRMQRKKELEKELYLSSKHTIYLFSIWFVLLLFLYLVL